MDPRIRIRIHTKMSWIRNTAIHKYMNFVRGLHSESRDFHKAEVKQCCGFASIWSRSWSLFSLWYRYGSNFWLRCGSGDPTLHFNENPDPAPHERKCKSTTTDLQNLHSSILSLLYASIVCVHSHPRLNSEPPKLLNFAFDVDPDPAITPIWIWIRIRFPKNDADPDPQHCCELQVITRYWVLLPTYRFGEISVGLPGVEVQAWRGVVLNHPREHRVLRQIVERPVCQAKYNKSKINNCPEYFDLWIPLQRNHAENNPF